MEQPSPILPTEKVRYSNVETPLLTRLLGSFAAHRSVILFSIASLITLTVLHHIFLPLYTAKAVLLVQRAENSPLQAMMGKMTGNPSFGQKRNEYLEKYLHYLNSREFFLAAARVLKNKPRAPTDSAPPTPTRELLTRVRSAMNKLFYVKVTDPSAIANEIEELAEQLRAGASFVKTSQDNLTAQVSSRNFRESVQRANFLVETAVKVITETELKELTDAKRYIESELASTGVRLQGFDAAIVDYRKRNNLVKTDAGGREVLERVADLKRNLESNQLKFEQNQKLVGLLSNELQKQEAQIFTQGARSLQSSEVLNQLREQMQAMRYKKMLFQAQGLTEDASQIRNIDQQIDQIAGRLKERIRSQGGNEDDVASLLTDDKDSLVRKISYLKRENQYLSTSIETLDSALRAALQPLEALPEAQQKMVGFNRNTHLEFSLLQEMKKKTLEIELERVALDSKIRVLETATIAGIPARYNVLPKAILAAFLGLLICTGAAYAVDELSSTIKGKRELAELGMIVVGSVPRVEAPSRWNFLRIGKGVVDVIAPWKSDEECAEIMAFKHVRATVLKMKNLAGNSAKTICVLGATPGDGKSFISANIGFALAQMGKKTLILDGDLRRPTLGLRLKISSKVGLTSILTGAKSLDECLTRDVLPNLDVLPSGPMIKNATELLSGSELTNALEILKSRYDYIVIDTPPLLPVVDGLILAAASDAMVFAVSHRKTRLPDIQLAMEKVRHFDSRPVFVVYNRVGEGNQYSYVYSYIAPRQKHSPPSPAGSEKNLRDELASFKKSWRGKNLAEDNHVS